MVDRCDACGGWLQPGDAFCATCHARVGAERRPEAAWPELELETAEPRADRSGSPQPVPPGASAPEEIGTGLGSGPPDAPPGSTGGTAGPLGSTSDAPGPAEVTRTAGYGTPPTGWLPAVVYAMHVWHRRRMLGTALAEAQRARAAAGKRASQALARLGQALAERAGELDLGPLDDPLRAVARARAEAEQLRATEEEAAADAEARRAELQREVEQASKEADPWRDRETKLRTQLEARQHDARRGEAQARRAEIELRNARSTRADEERTALLESDLAARRSELELAQQKVRELTAELGQARRELATRLGRVATLTEEQKRSESALEKASRVHGSAGRQARQSLEEAYETLGRYALERGYGQAAPDHVEAARTAWAELERRRRAALLYERARLAYDRDAFRRGSIVVGSAAGVILAAIVVAIAV